MGDATLSIYSRLYDFMAGAVVRSQEFDDEFNAIAAASRTTIRAVDEVATDLPNAAARANRLMSFDASGQPQASNSVPDPVADTDVANKRWVQTLALSATIPVLPGDSGKVLGNNGSTVQWTATDTLFPSMAGNAGKFLGTDGTTRSWMRPVITITFDNRGDMRSLSGVDLQAWVLVDGLGVFQHMASVDEGPDDDETAFATASGYWLLVCPSWDVVNAMTLLAVDEDSSRLDESESFAARFLQQTSTQSAFTLGINSSTTFTVTVTGAAVGASVIATPPTNPTLNTIALYARVTATNTATVYIGNASAASTGGFGAGDWQITVINK
jgi:hypothetical protein